MSLLKNIRLPQSLLLIFLFLSVLGSFLFYQKKNANFTLSNITIDLPHNPKYAGASQADKEAAQAILAQPFFYLAKGKQSYAFESADGCYILKIMKCNRLKIHWLYKLIPPLYKKKQKEKQKKREALFNSYLLAATTLKEHTGVIFLHLNMTPDLEMQVKVRDKLGFWHILEIDASPFVLQRKIIPFLPYMKTLWKKRQVGEIKKHIFQLIDCISSLVDQGFRDADPSLIAHNNVGVLDDKIAYIDIGTFKCVRAKQKIQLLKKDYKSLEPLFNWLKNKDLQLANECKEHIFQTLHSTKK